jgi:serine/threonine protein kinase/WD40 repeat protein
MTGAETGRNPVEQLAEAFLERYRRGERPSLDEYTSQHPELAEQIRLVFPALVMMEEIGPGKDQETGRCPSPETADGRPLERIGDYHIFREIGRGGMGIVYEAEQEALGRHVALKVLPSQAAADPVSLKRFRREARSAARLHHTNIVSIFDVGEHCGTQYYAMQFIEGLGLDDVLRELKRMRGKPEGPQPSKPATDRSLLGSLAGSLIAGQFREQDARDAGPYVAGARVEQLEKSASDAGGIAASAVSTPEVSRSIPSPPTCGGRGEGEGGNWRTGNGSSSGELAGAAGESSSVILKSASGISTQSDFHFFRSVARIGLQVADALTYAHGQKVLHRDIKPSNLLLDVQGTVWITDFGLAKEEGEDLTRTGDLVGTLRYMAPERFNGLADARSDIYGLGLTLYELLTLRPAFDASEREVLIKQVMQEEPPRPRRLEPLVPRDLETIVLKASEKEPGRRYPSAADLAEDLRRFLADRPIQARRATIWEHVWRLCRRNPLPAALVGAVILFMVATAVVSLIFAVSLRVQRDRAEAAESETLLSLGRTQQAERQATDRLFEALVTRVQGGRSSGIPGQRFANLESIRQAAEIARAQGRPAGDFLQLRNEAVACLALPDLQLETDWEGNPLGTNGLGFDATFERYAWSFQDEGIRVRRLRDHVEQCRVPTPPSNCVPRWVLLGFSPNGRYLAAYYVQWQELHPLEVWELREGAARRIVAIPDATTLPTFAADGRSLVVPLPKGEAAMIDLPSGQERRRLPSGGPVEALAPHPGGELLAVAGGRSEGVRLLDLQKGSVVHRLSHPDTVQGLGWSVNGKLLATACNDFHVHLWDAVSWQKEGELSGHQFDVGNVAFDPTGRWLASFGWDMTLRFWEVGSRRQLLKVDDIRVLDFRSKGGLAAAGLTGRRVQVWGFRPSEVLQELHLPQMLHANAGFSPDGRWLMTTTGGRNLRVWDFCSRQEVYHHPEQGDVSWAPDGTWILMQGIHGFLRVPVLPRPKDMNAESQIVSTESKRLSTQFSARSTIFFGQPRQLAGLHEDVRDHFVTWAGTRVLLADPSYGRSSRVRLLELDGDTIRVVWERRIPNANQIAASPDGCLVAVGSYGGGGGVSVWEVDTGRLVRKLPIGDARVSFSADNRRLYATTGRLSPQGAECRSWWVGSWESDRAVPLKRTSHAPASLAVAADGTVAVVSTNNVSLLNPETLEEVTTICAPEPGWLQGFSPDSTKLVCSANGTVQLWDLRRLRHELAALGLDWNSASLPPKDHLRSPSH